MIEAFAAYIKTIAAFLIFSCMADLAAPENGYKKYMQVVLGFLMVLVILQPIQKIFTKDSIDFFAQAVEEKVLAADAVTGQRAIRKGQEDTQMVTEIYKQKLSETMKESLAQEGIFASKVEVTVKEEESQKDYGQILSVFVELEEGEAGKQEPEARAVKIEPVIVAFPEAEAETETKTGETKEEGERKKQAAEIIARDYGVEKENITIQIRP